LTEQFKLGLNYSNKTRQEKKDKAFCFIGAYAGLYKIAMENHQIIKHILISMITNINFLLKTLK